MLRTVSLVLKAFLKKMFVGTVTIWHSPAIVLPMITGTHHVSARTHSGKYQLMENCLWLLSINGKDAGSDLVCRTGSLCAASARQTGTWAAVACGNAYGKRSPCDVPL